MTSGREIDKSASFVMMDWSYSCGISFFDTASGYGNGNSEAIVGEWLTERHPVSDSNRNKSFNVTLWFWSRHE